MPSDGRGAALEALRGERRLRADGAGAGAPGDASREFSLIDRSYPEMAYPDREYRLLALFRFWNVIDRFFPYKELMDRTWDETLLEFIPRMDAAADALEYTLAVAELAARIQDSHGMIINPIYDRYTGRLEARRPGQLRRGPVGPVPHPGSGPPRRKGSISGTSSCPWTERRTEDRRARLKRFLPASTSGRLEAKVDMTLLAGDPERPAAISLRKASGKIVNVTLPRTPGRAAPAGVVLPCRMSPCFPTVSATSTSAASWMPRSDRRSKRSRTRRAWSWICAATPSGAPSG